MEEHGPKHTHLAPEQCTANLGSLQDVSSLETHELMHLQQHMSTSGQLQLLRTILKPEASALAALMFADALPSDPLELMMRGEERRNEASLAQCELLDLFRRTQKFDGYEEARELCKRALDKLSLLKHTKKLITLTPGTVEFDVEDFFFDFMPWKYKRALVMHQGTIADAAGRGDLEFFKRLYNKVKNDEAKKAGGQYEHFLATSWLHGFLWLMPDRLACREVASRLERLFEVGEKEGFEARKSASDRKREYTKKVSDYEKLKAACSHPEEDDKPQSANRPQHEKLRNRFRQAVKSLGLYQHPESPIVEIRKPGEGEPNSSCYVWKSGWPK